MFGACLVEIAAEDRTKPYDFLEIDPQNRTIVTDAPLAATVVVDFMPVGCGSWWRSRESVASALPASEPCSPDFDSEVTMIHDREELLTLVELEKLRKRSRRSVPNQQRAVPTEETW